MSTARVASLHVYPVKGCRGVAVRTARLELAGIRHDRQLALIGPDGAFVSQRHAPRLALTVPELAPLDAGRLHVTAAGRCELQVRLTQDGPRRTVAVWAYRGPGIDQGDAAAAWFTAVAGLPVRLVAFPAEHVREVDPQYGRGLLGFADDFPVHLVSTASLADLSRRLGAPIEADRFRPNVLVDGWTEPYAEDTTATLQVGDPATGVTFDVVRAAPRCVITGIDQTSGERGINPLPTLATYRRGPLGLHFGQHLVPRLAGQVTVGDEVSVLAAGRPGLGDSSDARTDAARLGQGA